MVRANYTTRRLGGRFGSGRGLSGRARRTQRPPRRRARLARRRRKRPDYQWVELDRRALDRGGHSAAGNSASRKGRTSHGWLAPGSRVPPPEPFELEDRGAPRSASWRGARSRSRTQRRRLQRSLTSSRYITTRVGHPLPPTLQRSRLGRGIDQLIVVVRRRAHPDDVSLTSPSRGRGGRRRPGGAPAEATGSLWTARPPVETLSSLASASTVVSGATPDRATRAMSTRVPSSPDVRAEVKVHMGRRRGATDGEQQSIDNHIGDQQARKTERQPGACRVA